MTIDQIFEEVGLEADNVDNIIHAARMPLPSEAKLAHTLSALERLRDRLRSLYIEASGENPWEDQP